MTDKKDIRIFERDGLKCECRVIRPSPHFKNLYIVDTPAGDTWVREDEFLTDGETI